MHRVLSFQMSNRAENQAHEFVSKRLCCSFMFSIAFLSLLGGFLLGRYATERALIIRNKAAPQLKLIDGLIEALNAFEDAISNSPQELVSTKLVTMLECRDYSIPVMNKTAVDHSKDMLDLHLSMLTSCVGNATTFLVQESEKYN